MLPSQGHCFSAPWHGLCNSLFCRTDQIEYFPSIHPHAPDQTHAQMLNVIKFSQTAGIDNVLAEQTCLRARSISNPWAHGTAGLARQSPLLPRRLMSILCLCRKRNASVITCTASYVRAEVYCKGKKYEDHKNVLMFYDRYNIHNK